MRLNKVLVMAGLVLTLAACTKVPTGHVGVKVHLLGGAKGVDTEELGVGRYWIGFNEELFLFPTFTQNHTYDQSNRIGFQTREGLTVEADIGVTYHIQPEKVSEVFQKYRKGIDEITNVFLRNMIRDALVKKASSLPIESVYGAGKADLIESVLQEVVSQTQDIGITIEKLYWVGELQLPSNVTAAINQKIQATQMAEQRENEVRQAIAEAQKIEEAAKGEAKARLAIAQAEAEAIRLKGQALNDYPLIVELNTIEKWDGTLPTVTGGATPLIKIGDK